MNSKYPTGHRISDTGPVPESVGPISAPPPPRLSDQIRGAGQELTERDLAELNELRREVSSWRLMVAALVTRFGDDGALFISEHDMMTPARLALITTYDPAGPGWRVALR